MLFPVSEIIETSAIVAARGDPSKQLAVAVAATFLRVINVAVAATLKVDRLGLVRYLSFLVFGGRFGRFLGRLFDDSQDFWIGMLRRRTIDMSDVHGR